MVACLQAGFPSQEDDVVNYRGSSRRLLGNSMSAMLAAIEIYNKPRFPYRDEVAVVMLINARELILKAVLSKSGSSIYYPKRRQEQQDSPLLQ
ncbi:DUF3644 domain-containing protein [[Mycobacterium] kokjensenii]|uniref:DUF3644 domain-containing protein n=1 Tax=[Mycobacterium] kokjensenii TaxID=3064287 RepID=UPI0035A11BEC